MRNLHQPARAGNATYNVLKITFAGEPPRVVNRTPRPGVESVRTGHVIIRCHYCDTTFRMEQPEHSATLWTFRYDHAETCAPFRAAIACERGRVGEREWLRTRVAFIGKAFKVEAIMHKRRADRELTQCGSACRKAVGSDCDRRCYGKFHGVAHDARFGHPQLVLLGFEPS